MNHVTTVRSYGTDLQDERYKEFRHKLLWQDTSDQDVDYHLMIYGLVRFKDMIYVLDDSGLKKLILREFYVKPYSGYLRYQKMLTIVKTLYYKMDLKKEVTKFVARWLNC